MIVIASPMSLIKIAAAKQTVMIPSVINTLILNVIAFFPLKMTSSSESFTGSTTNGEAVIIAISREKLP
jgi:hypothetical protein